MSEFIELHRCDREETQILINVNHIAYIQSVKNEAIIYLAKSCDEGAKDLLRVFVKESYEELKALIVGS